MAEKQETSSKSNRDLDEPAQIDPSEEAKKKLKKARKRKRKLKKFFKDLQRSKRTLDDQKNELEERLMSAKSNPNKIAKI